MFTGIIQAQAAIHSTSQDENVKHVRIGKPRKWKLIIGASVCVDGICSTVVKESDAYFDVEYMQETLSKTTATLFEKGDRVNLERSLNFGDSVDGHFVSGHVDAYAIVSGIKKSKGAFELSLGIPTELSRFVVAQGSLALNGVSLTVARKQGDVATVALIPHTLAKTNLSNLKKGDFVNVEVDMLARYALAQKRGGGRVPRNAAKRIRKKAGSA